MLLFLLLSGVGWALTLREVARIDVAAARGKLAEARSDWERLQLEQDIGNVPITPAFLQAKYFCSVRLAEAEIGLARSGGEQRAALRHHLERMEDLNRVFRQMTCNEGTRPVWVAQGFVAEAKGWVAAGER
jgi:hypothetical protein